MDASMDASNDVWDAVAAAVPAAPTISDRDRTGADGPHSPARSSRSPSSRGRRHSSASHSSACGTLDSDSDEDRERDAEAQGEVGVYARGAALTAAQREHASERLRALTAALLHNGGRPLPSKMARQLRVMVAQSAPSLLRVCHRFSMMDGSNPEVQAEAEAALPPGASPRRIRPPRALSASDMAVIREEEIKHLWQQVAAQLQDDWDRIYQSCSLLDAKDAATLDKETSMVDGVSLVYGEVCFPSLATVLARHWRDLGLAPGEGSFIDIGSGSGRGVFGAMLVHDFKRIMGVEILRSLVAQSRRVHEEYEREYATQLRRKDEARAELDRKLVEGEVAAAAAVAEVTAGLAAAGASSVEASSCSAATVGPSSSAPSFPAAAASSLSLSAPAPGHPSLPPSPHISFVHGDFRDLDWSAFDVVLANSTCFDEDLMADLALYAQRLRRGALVLTFTKPLRSDHFRVVSDEVYEMSWGNATVYAQRKVRPALWERIEKRHSDDVQELDKVMPDMPRESTSAYRFECVLREQQMQQAEAASSPVVHSSPSSAGAPTD